MTNQPPPPPVDDELYSLLCDPDAERDLVGALIYDGVAFERANIKSSDFSIQRYRWIWEACEAIRAADDHIDEPTIEKELRKAGRFEEVTALHGLLDYYDPDALLHVEANARRLRDLAERRRIVAAAFETICKASDQNTPLPSAPEPRKTRWTFDELKNGVFPEPAGPIPGIITHGLAVLGGRSGARAG